MKRGAIHVGTSGRSDDVWNGPPYPTIPIAPRAPRNANTFRACSALGTWRTAGIGQRDRRAACPVSRKIIERIGHSKTARKTLPFCQKLYISQTTRIAQALADGDEAGSEALGAPPPGPLGSGRRRGPSGRLAPARSNSGPPGDARRLPPLRRPRTRGARFPARVESSSAGRPPRRSEQVNRLPPAGQSKHWRDAPDSPGIPPKAGPHPRWKLHDEQ